MITEYYRWHPVIDGGGGLPNIEPEPQPIEPTVDSTVEKWTHKLVLGFRVLPWLKKDQIDWGVKNLLVPSVNPFITVLTYKYVGYKVDMVNKKIIIFYRKTGSPAVPLAAILAAVAAILIGIGIVIYSIAWYKRETRLEKESKTIDELYQEGAISTEDYVAIKQSLLEEERPGLPDFQAMLYIVLFIAVLSAVK